MKYFDSAELGPWVAESASVYVAGSLCPAVAQTKWDGIMIMALWCSRSLSSSRAWLGV